MDVGVFNQKGETTANSVDKVKVRGQELNILAQKKKKPQIGQSSTKAGNSLQPDFL